MKIVRITHYRCGEPDGYTFAVVPEGKTDNDVEADVRKAQDLYFAAVAAFKAANEKPEDGGDRPLEMYADNLTIGEAKRLRLEAIRKRQDYREQERAATRPYDSFLHELGYQSLWDDLPGIVECNVDWGHRHGEQLNYESKTPDGYDPGPKKDQEDPF